MQQQINKANSIMGLIRRTYTYLDEQSFKYLFQALLRPHLEYAAAVWSPYKSSDIENIENVQRRATKLIPSLKNLEYADRLRKLQMPTLRERPFNLKGGGGGYGFFLQKYSDSQCC